MDDLVAILVPLGLFASCAFAVYTRYYFLSKTSIDQQDTLRAAIASGQKLDEDTVAVLIKRPSSPENDLKSGIMLLSFGVGFALAGIVARMNGFDNELGSVLNIVGVIVAAGGIGNIISYKLRSNLHKQSEKNKVGE